MTTAEPIALQCWRMWSGHGHAEHRVQLPGLHGVLYARPCQAETGGDLHYLSACGSGVMARVCVADASGHGEHAAQVGAWLEEVFGKQIHHTSPAGVLREVNARLARNGLDSIATAACLSYNSTNGALRYCYAGHPRVLHWRRDSGTLRALDLAAAAGPPPHNIPLGITGRVAFDVGLEPLSPGDRLLVYTDGAYEAPDAAGERFGMARLQRIFSESATQPVAEQMATLREAIEAHARTLTQEHDDLTLLLLEAAPFQRGGRLYHFVKNNLGRK